MTVLPFTLRRKSFTADVFAVLLLSGSIAAAVLAIYGAQVWYFRPPIHLPAGLPAGSQLITGITTDDVFDLSGSEASGGGSAFNLFDDGADPANGKPGHPSTNPLPAALPIFFPPGRGLRIVVDLHDTYRLTDFYLYDKSFESDTVWVYTGNMNHWLPAAVLRTTEHCAAWGWRHFSLSAASRFVMIRFNSSKSIITALSMYGIVQPAKEPDALPRLTPLIPPTLRDFAGTNVYDYVAPGLLQPFSQVRLYQQLDYFDTDTVHAYPKNIYSLNTAGMEQVQQLRYYAHSIRHTGGRLWMSIRGLPSYLEKQGMNERDKPVTLRGMNTEDPMSYRRHAATFWTMAALFGSTAVDTSRIRVEGASKFSGLQLMDRFENGNEEDGYWSSYYWTPVDYFAMSTADYDGNEGQMGAGHGLQDADKKSQLMTSGMIQLDTNRVKTLYFLCRQLRRDKKFIWQGGVQYHYYSNTQTARLQSPLHGLSPEVDSMRKKLAKVRAFHDRLLPGIPLVLGENGYDRSQQSWQNTPLLPGRSAAQSQGIMCIRSLMAAFMAGFDGYNQYMMRNATNDENLPGPYASSGMIGGPANDVIYSGWYYWSAVMQHLGNYKRDSILSETGQVWVYRLKNRDNSTRKAYVLCSPTTNGSVIKRFSLPLQSTYNQSFKIIQLDDKSPSGMVTTGTSRNGLAVVTVGESPVLVVMD